MNKEIMDPTYTETAPRFYVVHPLDDAPEKKCSPAGLGLIPLTGAARFSLMALRGYLICMILLVLYHALALARIL